MSVTIIAYWKAIRIRTPCPIRFSGPNPMIDTDIIVTALTTSVQQEHPQEKDACILK